MRSDYQSTKDYNRRNGTIREDVGGQQWKGDGLDSASWLFTCSSHHGGQTERGNKEVYSGGRPGRPGGNADVGKVGQVLGGEVVDSYERVEEEEDIVVDAVFDLESVELM